MLPSAATGNSSKYSQPFESKYSYPFDFGDFKSAMPLVDPQGQHLETQTENPSLLALPRYAAQCCGCVMSWNIRFKVPCATDTSSDRFSNWPTSYDSFAPPSGRMSPSDHQERLRSRMPYELQTATRGLPRSVPQGRRPLSYTSTSSMFSNDHTAFVQNDLPRASMEDPSRRQSQEIYGGRSDSPGNQSYGEYDENSNRRSADMSRSAPRFHTRRRPFNQDEFDGPSQLLPLPLPQQESSRSQDLPSLPVNLSNSEQDEITQHVNDILSQCAFHFVAKYQFPVPLERDKPRVRAPADREWTEWAYLLKRLATKRRIPARVLFDGQIKQLVTTLENSIAARQNRDQQNRTAKDDRYILQLISSGSQVAKILMDSQAMEQLDSLYTNTESILLERRARARFQ